ncbi:MAG: AAA family ATPase [Sphingomonas sp.]
MRDFMLRGKEVVEQTDAPYSEVWLDEPSVVDALARLFRGKCAFCETSTKTSVHRFRPQTNANPAQSTLDAHLYYVWLAEAWQNLFPICLDCQPREPGFFPVEGRRARLPGEGLLDKYLADETGNWPTYPPKETPLLLDPTQIHAIWNDLKFGVNGMTYGRTQRGSTTIETFSLNRERLVAARAGRFREYFALISEAAHRGKRTAPAAAFQFKTMEFGGGWYLVLRRIARAIGGSQWVAPAKIKAFFSAQLKEPDAARLIDLAWEQVGREAATDAAVKSAPLPMTFASLAKVIFANFKAIESLTITLPDAAPPPTQGPPPPVPSLLMIGENAAGKSSILEGIALSLSTESARDMLNLTADKFVLDPRLMGAAALAPPPEASVTIELTDGSSNRVVFSDNDIRDTLTDGYGRLPVFAYGAYRQYQTRETQSSDIRHVRNLFYNTVLSNPEDWLLSLDDKEGFPMVARVLRHILGFEHDFDFIRRDRAGKRCFLVSRVAGPGNTTIDNETPLSLVSSGFRSVLAMSCDIMAGLMNTTDNPNFTTLVEARGVVLIDEVEAHLHPRWKMYVMRGLRAGLPRMTFIATTHDPLCLRGMGDGEVAVLQRVAAPQGETAGGLPVLVEQLDAKKLPNVSQLTVEQLLTSDLFQLYSADKPETDQQLAMVCSYMVRLRDKPDEKLLAHEQAALEAFKKDVNDALPIGTSAAQRLVQEAVAEYLRDRRGKSETLVQGLRTAAKDKIVKILKAG